MNSFAKVCPMSLMSLSGVAWWTCMQNVGALRMLGECFNKMPSPNVSLLERYHIRTCEMQARAEGTRALLEQSCS
jgi:hypothetical protein